MLKFVIVFLALAALSRAESCEDEQDEGKEWITDDLKKCYCEDQTNFFGRPIAKVRPVGPGEKAPPPPKRNFVATCRYFGCKLDSEAFYNPGESFQQDGAKCTCVKGSEKWRALPDIAGTLYRVDCEGDVRVSVRYW